MKRHPLFFLFCLGAFSGCDEPIVDATTYEGDDPGECTDGADNDRNGLFDCADSQCAASPDCDPNNPGGGGDGGGDGGNGGGDTDDPPGELLYETVHIEYTFAVDFASLWEAYPYEFTDCVQIFEADATAVEGFTSGTRTRTTFFGEWRQVSTTCPTDSYLDLNEAIWHDAVSGQGHTTIITDGDLLEAWVVHKDPEDYEINEPENKFFIYDIFVDISSGTAAHSEEETDSSGYNIGLYTHTLRVTVE